MKTTELTPKMRRTRQFLLAVPLLALPFLTLFFWTFGGGKASSANAKNDTAKGFNMNLPGAQLKNNENLNKMSYYSQAAADSAKIKQAQQTDPYAKKTDDTVAGHSFFAGAAFSPHQPTAFEPVNGRAGGSPEANEAQVYQKLAALQAAINKPPAPNQITATQSAGNYTPNPTVAAALKPQEDPQMNQMNGLLEKILDIQHPDRLKTPVSGKDSAANSEKFRAIPAVIDGNQKVTEGTVVRIKLLDSVTINGQLFPRGQLIYGAGNLYNQRMTITIKNIHVGYEIIPVNLTVYDMIDGLEGISVPEAITADAAKDGAADGVEGMQFMSMDETMGAQAATAGINAAKGLFSKKVKRVKAKLKNGHPLLLRNNTMLRAAHH